MYHYTVSYHIPDSSLSDLNKALEAALSAKPLAWPNQHVVEMLPQDPQHWCTSGLLILFATMKIVSRAP